MSLLVDCHMSGLWWRLSVGLSVFKGPSLQHLSTVNLSQMEENQRKVFNCWEIYFIHKRMGRRVWRGILQQRFKSVLLGSILTIYILFQVHYAPFDQTCIQKPKAESIKEEGRFLATVSERLKTSTHVTCYIEALHF